VAPNTRKELFAVIVVVGLGVLAMAVLQPVLPLYLTSIGISPKMLGLMFSAAMAGMMRGESGWGWTADRVGIKFPLGLGTIACTLVVILFVFTRKTLPIFFIFFFWGVFSGTFYLLFCPFYYPVQE